MADLEWGVLDLFKYVRGVTGSFTEAQLGKITTARQGVEMLTTDGLGVFGVLQAGTPDDIIAYIERLQRQSGGFGCLMFLAHNCATFEAVKKSYELFARYVVPHFTSSNENRLSSLQWAHDNSASTWGSTVSAMKSAIENKGMHTFVK